MFAEVRVGELRRWLREVADVPSPTVEPLTGLLAQYGKSLGRSKEEERLVVSLIQYVQTRSRGSEIDFDTFCDPAELQLDQLQRERGDYWEIGMQRFGPRMLTLEPGLSRGKARAVTAETLLLVLACAVAGVEEGSDVSAIRVVQPVLRALLISTASDEFTVGPSLSRARKALGELMRWPSEEIHDPDAELVPEDVVRIYRRRAAGLSDDDIVKLRRALPEEVA